MVHFTYLAPESKLCRTSSKRVCFSLFAIDGQQATFLLLQSDQMKVKGDEELQSCTYLVCWKKNLCLLFSTFWVSCKTCKENVDTGIITTDGTEHRHLWCSQMFAFTSCQKLQRTVKKGQGSVLVLSIICEGFSLILSSRVPRFSAASSW